MLLRNYHIEPKNNFAILNNELVIVIQEGQPKRTSNGIMYDHSVYAVETEKGYYWVKRTDLENNASVL